MAISLDAIYFISASSCGSSTLLPCITSCAKQARIIVRSQADSTEDLAVVLQVSCWQRGAKAVCDVLMGVVALALGCVSILICSLRTEVLHVGRLPLAIGSLLN